MEEKPLDLSKKSASSTRDSQRLPTEKKQKSLKEHLGTTHNKRATFYEIEFSEPLQNSERSFQQEGLQSRLLSDKSKRHETLEYGGNIPGSYVMQKRVSEMPVTDSGPECQSAVFTLDSKNKHRPTKISDSNCFEKGTPKRISPTPSTSAGASCSYNSTGIQRHLRKKRDKFHMNCGYCNKAFNYHSVYKMHVRTHTGEKPFECQHCDKRFARNNELKVHTRVHTGERPFPCKECGKAFASSSLLKLHRVSHTEERPFKCDICGLDFKRNSHLIRHKITHEEKKK